MSDYELNLDEIETGFTTYACQTEKESPGTYEGSGFEDYSEACRGFRKWFAQHEREVRAQALEDAADAMDADPDVRDPLSIRADWLRARAEKERQSGNPTTPAE